MNKKLLATVAGLAILGGATLFSDPAIQSDPVAPSDSEVAPPSQVEVPTKEYLKDTTTDTPLYDIPDGQVCMYVGLTRENWPEKGEGKNVVEVSETFFDGKTWLPESLLFKTDGGIRKDKDGQIFPEGSWEGGIGDGKGRKIVIRTKALEDINTKVVVKFNPCL